MARRPRLLPGNRWWSRRRLTRREAWEAFVRDFAVQASIGRIRQTVDALNIEITYDRVTLHACVLEPDSTTACDLEQIRRELEHALELMVTPTPEVTLATAYGVNGPDWDGFWHMSLYKAHWSTRDGDESSTFDQG